MGLITLLEHSVNIISERWISVRLALAFLAGVLGACGSSEGEAGAKRAAEQVAIAKAEDIATRAAALPATGLWTEEHLMDRLVRTGVLPRAHEQPPPETPWMGGAPLALRAGGGEVYVWIFPDSGARRAVSDQLDPGSGVPNGAVSPWRMPLQVVFNNNLVAVITGGNVRNQERIALALQAGLPVRP